MRRVRGCVALPLDWSEAKQRQPGRGSPAEAARQRMPSNVEARTVGEKERAIKRLAIAEELNSSSLNIQDIEDLDPGHNLL